MYRNISKSVARQVVFNVFQECMAKFQAGKFRLELDDVYGRTAKLTGVSLSTVRRIVDEGFKNEGKLVTPGKGGKNAGVSGNITGAEYLDSDE